MIRTSLLFLLLAGCTLSGCSSKDGLEIKGQELIYRGVIVSDPESGQPLNAKNFTLLSPWFAKDTKHVYVVAQSTRDYGKVRLDPLDGATPAGFALISESYGKEGAKVFSARGPLQNVDGNTFRLLEEGFSSDKANVYSGGCRIDGADPATFKVLGAQYSADQRSVFQGCTLLPGLDPKTIRMLGHNFVKDSKAVFYHFYRVENADAPSFTVINGDFEKDANSVYYQGTKLQGSDPATFETEFHFFSSMVGRDSRHTYAQPMGGGLIIDGQRTSIQGLLK